MAIREALDEIIERPNPERRERSCPRKIKRQRHNTFPVKRKADKNISHDSPPTIILFRPAA
jgi:hypothetical protein